ncbi:MAG: hypothetical protein IIC09_00495 [Proteobacteria bacterium]|nr:hypothetical protein [Pseudomonadota bacterium]
MISILLGAFAGLSAAQEFSGNIAAESLTFSESGLDPRQMDDNITLSFKPKWTGDWNHGDDAWSAELFLRADDRDDGREHFDIREFYWLHLDGDNEWRVGINTMFWGVTESQHLVDVINQIDQVEGVDGEDKLGQPMVHLKHYEDWGVLDFLVLPGFRERTFRGSEGARDYPWWWIPIRCCMNRRIKISTSILPSDFRKPTAILILAFHYSKGLIVIRNCYRVSMVTAIMYSFHDTSR